MWPGVAICLMAGWAVVDKHVKAVARGLGSTLGLRVRSVTLPRPTFQKHPAYHVSVVELRFVVLFQTPLTIIRATKAPPRVCECFSAYSFPGLLGPQRTSHRMLITVARHPIPAQNQFTPPTNCAKALATHGLYKRALQ